MNKEIEATTRDEQERQTLDRVAVFKALGDPTRLRLFEFLRDCTACCDVAVDDAGDVRPVSPDGPTVGEVCCSVTGAAQITSTVSRHLRELKLAGLITIERRGKHMVCGVNRAVLAQLSAYFGDNNSGSGGSRCC